MTTENAATENDEQISLPLDLTEWVEKTTLLEWIEEEVDKFDWKHPELEAYLSRHPEYRPKMLLCLLAYAYATQVFTADEIVGKCNAEVIYRLICQDNPPTQKEVTRFRRENRGLLKGLLVPVFIRALKSKFQLGDILLPPGLKRYLLDQAVERLDIARHMDRVEV
ncbi:MAG: transposase [Verrucomicrobia bacterium]|nr:transposase [Verrucomicrobiota bacterium]